MAANKSLLILPGDGIGPEIMVQVRRVIDWFDKRRAVGFDVLDGLVGGASWDVHGTPLTDEVMSEALEADAVLLGACGAPKYDNVPRELRPERGLLRLRKEMDLFANLRPSIVFDALVDASTLKPEVVRGLDILILRELTAGVYFGEPRGVEVLADGTRRAIDTQSYTEAEIQRIAAVAFDLARKRGNKVHSVDKANVMESGAFWREVVAALHEDKFSDVELHHMYADNCAMQLVRWPAQFDVIVTDNLFGDILSDCAAMLTGSLGMLPSASLGPQDETGRRRAMYEPVHGSAPDITGKDMANPLATILSYAMMLRYSFGLGEDADLVETAVQNVLASGVRTADIAGKNTKPVSTTQMGDAILAELDKLAA
jgi:3-isopropylmalate dehydrogenase